MPERRNVGVSRSPVVVGVDLGGTGIRWGRVTRDGRFVGRPVVVSLPDWRRAAVVAQLRSVLAAACERPGRIAAVGMGVPGFIHRARGVVLRSPNFPDWINVPLRRILQRQLAVPLVLENDANAAALGEASYGAGRGRRSPLIMLTLGTGVGGGIVVNEGILTGRDGIAGEIGHQTVVPDGPVCGCGNHGCLEMYASTTGLVAGYRRRTGRHEALSGLILADRARRGDPDAKAVFADMGWALGITLANLINLLNPSQIVFGGKLSAAWGLFHRPMKHEISQRAIRAAAAGVMIRRTRLGSLAGVLGAARAAWQVVAAPGSAERPPAQSFSRAVG